MASWVDPKKMSAVTLTEPAESVRVTAEVVLMAVAPVAIVVFMAVSAASS